MRPDGRSRDEFNELSESLTKAWDEVVNDGRAGRGDKELRAVMILGTIVAGREAGFVLPAVSEIFLGSDAAGCELFEMEGVG